MVQPNIVVVPLRGCIVAHTVNELWDSFIDFENMYRGYLAATKGKRYHAEVLSFKAKLEENIFLLIKDLKDTVYKPLPFRQFWISEPKRRLISAPAFRDRVVYYALGTVSKGIQKDNKEIS